jgi:hypothetical protein
MTSKAKSDPGKIGPFSYDEVRALLMVIGLGVVLGVAVEMIDAALPKEHKMSAIVQSLLEGREARKRAKKSSYDMGRPDVGFNFTE